MDEGARGTINSIRSYASATRAGLFDRDTDPRRSIGKDGCTRWWQRSGSPNSTKHLGQLEGSQQALTTARGGSAWVTLGTAVLDRTSTLGLELRFEVRVFGDAASSVAALKARRRTATSPGVQVATLDQKAPAARAAGRPVPGHSR
jgi:hypothetical protein